MTIALDQLTLSLGRRPVLRGVSATFRPGELTGLIGPNGAGKTTLLRAVAGLLPPDSGSIRYDGLGSAQLGRRELARRVSYLGQGVDAAWPLTARALVGLGRLPHQRPFADETEEDRRAIQRALALCDVAAFETRPVETLSGGERRRVLLARALAVEAPWLLADEPLAALDPRHQLETMALLRRLATEGRGIVVVLHDLALAARFCDRLLLIDQGRMVAQGPPAMVLDDARLAAVFGIAALRGERDGEPYLLPWTMDLPR